MMKFTAKHFTSNVNLFRGYSELLEDRQENLLKIGLVIPPTSKLVKETLCI